MEALTQSLPDLQAAVTALDDGEEEELKKQLAFHRKKMIEAFLMTSKCYVVVDFFIVFHLFASFFT